MAAWPGPGVTILLLLLSGAQLAQCEVYTSVADLKQIATFMLQFTQKLSGSALTQSPLAQKMSQLVECLFDVTGAAQVNPVSAIKMVSLFTVELDAERLQQPEFFQLIKDQAGAANVTLPSNVDLVGSVNALGRLQITYGFTISQVMQGYFTQLHRTPMAAVCIDRLRPDASDCSVIAKNLKTHQALQFSLSKLWMYEAIKLSVENDGLSLVEAARQHASGQSDVALKLKQLVLQADTDPHFDYHNAIEWFLEDQLMFPTTVGDSSSMSGWRRSYNEYLRLCRASAYETYIPEKERSQLLCAYSDLDHPFFFIGPVKIEWVSYYPEVRVYHDVINTYEIAEIKHLARLVLSRSSLHNYSGDYYDLRVSKTAWLHLPQGNPMFDKVVKRLNHRSNLLARLNAEGTEDPQVLNYGLGGQYEPHYDYIPEPTDDYWVAKFGNRIATLMYYLSDVDAGGSTVFTELGVGVHPQKGSAVFWYNLMRNGDKDDLSMHAGCPVIVGEKWVVNMWHHATTQFDTFPCSIDREK